MTIIKKYLSHLQPGYLNYIFLHLNCILNQLPMNKTQPFQTKSIYLAFALCPCLSSNTYLDRDSGKFHFQLLKENNLIQKTITFNIDSMVKENEHYLYLCLHNYADKLNDSYTILMIDETEDTRKIVFDEKVDLNLYIKEHQQLHKDFWTQYYKAELQDQRLSVKQRVIMKRTKFELQDIINSSERGELYDQVDDFIPNSNDLKKSKFGVDKRKSKSYQTSIHSLMSAPRRLDTISQEDTNFVTDIKHRDFDENERSKFRMASSEEAKKSEHEFESGLLRQSTWVEKSSHNFDDEFITALDQPQKVENFLDPKDLTHQLKVQSRQSEYSQKQSKISKNTKDSEKELDDNSLSFLEKSSLLEDMDKSELSISKDDKFFFKLKWIVLVIFVLGLAVLASLSSDSFNITEEDDDKEHAKGVYKKSQKKDKTKKKPSNKMKPQKSNRQRKVHA